jgi:hypothetical protein
MIRAISVPKARIPKLKLPPGVSYKRKLEFDYLGGDGQFKIAKVTYDRSYSAKKLHRDEYFTKTQEHIAELDSKLGEIGESKEYKYDVSDAGLIIIPSHRAYHNNKQPS